MVCIVASQLYNRFFVHCNVQMNTDEAVRLLAEAVRHQHLTLATERACCARFFGRYCDLLKGLPLLYAR
jgi:hypothetical protein